jgi:hypothetical protein
MRTQFQVIARLAMLEDYLQPWRAGTPLLDRVPTPTFHYDAFACNGDDFLPQPVNLTLQQRVPQRCHVDAKECEYGRSTYAPSAASYDEQAGCHNAIDPCVTSPIH